MGDCVSWDGRDEVLAEDRVSRDGFDDAFVEDFLLLSCSNTLSSLRLGVLTTDEREDADADRADVEDIFAAVFRVAERRDEMGLPSDRTLGGGGR